MTWLICKSSHFSFSFAFILYTAVLKLFWLVALGLVVVYIYSVAAFAFFADEFNNPNSSDVQYCGSLVQCYVTIFHYILIGGVS